MRATITKYGMFKFDDRIAVAVSGGKDSINLLSVLVKMAPFRPKTSLVAVTVDEGIKGYRDEAMKIAAAQCERLGVEHHVVSFKALYGFTLDEIISRKMREGKKELSACAYCGVLRRRALNIAAREVGATKIATAHTLDDEVQTVLLNIFHGDVSRLVKEKPVTNDVHEGFLQRVKPFCEILERESALYAFVKDIPFQSTPCPYASEALRNDIRVMLNRIEEKHAGTKFTIFNSVERIRAGLKRSDGSGDYKECAECGEPSSKTLCKVCQMLKDVC